MKQHFLELISFSFDDISFIFVVAVVVMLLVGIKKILDIQIRRLPKANCLESFLRFFTFSISKLFSELVFVILNEFENSKQIMKKIRIKMKKFFPKIRNFFLTVYEKLIR